MLLEVPLEERVERGVIRGMWKGEGVEGVEGRGSVRDEKEREVAGEAVGATVYNNYYECNATIVMILQVRMSYRKVILLAVPWPPPTPPCFSLIETKQ